MNELSNEVIRISTDGFDTARDELRQTQRATELFAANIKANMTVAERAVFDAMDRDFGQGARAAKKHAEETAKAHAAGAASVVASQAKAAAAVKAATALRPPGVQTPAPLRGSYLERGENALRRGANSFAVSAGKQLDSLTAAVQARARQALGAATGGLSTAGRLGQRALDQVPEPVKAGALRVRDQAAAEFRYASMAASKGVAALGAVSARAKDGLGRMIEKLKGFESLQGIGTGAKALGVAGLATGAGLVANGFAGTVEMERFSRELTLLSRELAGAFRPLITGVTGLARDARKRLEKQGPAEQDQLLAGGVIAGGAVALNKGGNVPLLRAVPLVAAAAFAADKVGVRPRLDQPRASNEAKEAGGPHER